MANITKISPFANIVNAENIVTIDGIEFFTTNIGLYKHKDDLLVVHFPNVACVAGVFTKSSMASDPVLWCKEQIKNGRARVLIVNSGCSNTFTGEDGIEIINFAVQSACKKFGCKQSEVFVSSTGVIGQKFDKNLIPLAIENHSVKDLKSGGEFFTMTKAIETTDTFSKVFSSKNSHFGFGITGIIKGSGMIEPNMATMLCYIFTDANIDSKDLQNILNEIKEDTINAITVDSDSSTSDTMLVFSTNNSENKCHDMVFLAEFAKDLKSVALQLAKLVVMDGEGASKLITVHVKNAESKEHAKIVSKSIANSPLVKTAIAGADPNWGRIAMAVGKSCFNDSPYKIDKNKIKIYFGETLVAQNWEKTDYDSLQLINYLKGRYIDITVDIGNVNDHAHFTSYTCDLTSEYIKINADYMS